MGSIIDPKDGTRGCATRSKQRIGCLSGKKVSQLENQETDSDSE